MITSGGNQTPQLIYPEVASGKSWLAKRRYSSSEMIIVLNKGSAYCRNKSPITGSVSEIF